MDSRLEPLEQVRFATRRVDRRGDHVQILFAAISKD